MPCPYIMECPEKIRKLTFDFYCQSEEKYRDCDTFAELECPLKYPREWEYETKKQ